MSAGPSGRSSGTGHDPALTLAEEAAVRNRRLSQITPRVVPIRLPGQRPFLLVIGGQPAAGKSTIQELIQAALGSDRVAVYDRDDDPPAHPRFDANMRANGLGGNLVIAQSLPEDLRDHLLDNLRAQQCDVIASSPLQSEAATDFWVDGFRPHGYRMAAVFIATNEANSLLGMADRYQRSKDTVGFGRWLAKQLHDNAFAGMPDAAHAAEIFAKFDDIYVVDRDGNVLYENHRDDLGLMPPPHGARQTILDERDRPPTPAENEYFLSTATPLLNRTDLEPPVRHVVETAMRLHSARPAPQTLNRGQENRLDRRLMELHRMTNSGLLVPTSIPRQPNPNSPGSTGQAPGPDGGRTRPVPGNESQVRGTPGHEPRGR
ncbi:zeta toxin family protein [Kribbella solani]|uniref:UDP-N-acetylglucosamine kinase n=1 Tax=Kribbella solani TaxID=236067 RepID=A0A841DEA1_9ACTN|nr:zeta toxin family protein [Kribbella solani]MBB5976832.1 hypothetical protein [Kribbella solani]